MAETNPNFYDSVKEANMRLQYTIVTYDREPYHILTVAFHDDGIFRVYMEPIGTEKGPVSQWLGGLPADHPDPVLRGKMMDDFMKARPEAGIIRKHMNSPLFNKFRPFTLGMCNENGYVSYLERQPQRHTQQGLTQSMLYHNQISLTGMKSPYTTSIYSKSFKKAVMGEHPSLDECLGRFNEPNNSNSAVAFDRSFALVRGPVDSRFVAYKSDIVASLPQGDRSCIRISKKFSHIREVTEALSLFDKIEIMAS